MRLLSAAASVSLEELRALVTTEGGREKPDDTRTGIYTALHAKSLLTIFITYRDYVMRQRCSCRGMVMLQLEIARDVVVVFCFFL